MVPGAVENSVGFTAAMMVPCAAASRMKWPWLTVATRIRSAETVRFMPLHSWSSHVSVPIRSTATAAAI
ncbi:MAG: hypothetical protein WDO68_28005 [Gammaproteobacteria bacterium]